MPERPFHLAIAVHDLEAARRFYGDLLGCPEGRSSQRWIDFDLFGHQLSVHLTSSAEPAAETNPVDGDRVPARHFGVVLGLEEWRGWADRLEREGVPFVIEPRTRFAGEVGEQATLFVRDPSGNVMELKAFRDPGRLFASEEKI